MSKLLSETPSTIESEAETSLDGSLQNKNRFLQCRRLPLPVCIIRLSQLMESRRSLLHSTPGKVCLAAIAVASDRTVAVPALAGMESSTTVASVPNSSSESRTEL